MCLIQISYTQLDLITPPQLMAMVIGIQIVTNHRFRITDSKQGQVTLFLIFRIFRIDSVKKVLD